MIAVRIGVWHEDDTVLELSARDGRGLLQSAPFVVPHFVLNLIHEVFDLVLVKHLVVERHLTKDLDGIPVRWLQGGVLRTPHYEMNLNILGCANLDG